MAEFGHVKVTGNIHRLINSRWPPIGVFDSLADSEAELRILFNLEMATNPRLNAAIGRLALIPDGGIVQGDTANQIMAAFVHCHQDGGRFTDASLGAWYAACDVDTAIEETVHHLTKRLALSDGGFPQSMQMRELITRAEVPLLDLCGAQTSHPEFYDKDNYTAPQTSANTIRWPFIEDGEVGLRYDSVRNAGGINVCIFKPDTLNRPIVQGDHYRYNWNAKGEIYVDRLTAVKRP